MDPPCGSKFILISILLNLAPPRSSFRFLRLRFCAHLMHQLTADNLVEPTERVLFLLCVHYSNSPFAVQYYRPILRNTRQSWILGPITWIVDSGCWIFIERGFWIPCLSGILECLSSSMDSKDLDSGYHEQNFPGVWILQARILQILESGSPYMGRSTSQTFSDLFTLQAVGNLLFF